jgi:hypothetical protein
MNLTVVPIAIAAATSVAIAATTVVLHKRKQKGGVGNKLNNLKEWRKRKKAKRDAWKVQGQKSWMLRTAFNGTKILRRAPPLRAAVSPNIMHTRNEKKEKRHPMTGTTTTTTTSNPVVLSIRKTHDRGPTPPPPSLPTATQDGDYAIEGGVVHVHSCPLSVPHDDIETLVNEIREHAKDKPNHPYVCPSSFQPTGKEDSINHNSRAKKNASMGGIVAPSDRSKLHDLPTWWPSSSTLQIKNCFKSRSNNKKRKVGDTVVFKKDVGSRCGGKIGTIARVNDDNSYEVSHQVGSGITNRTVKVVESNFVKFAQTNAPHPYQHNEAYLQSIRGNRFMYFMFRALDLLVKEKYPRMYHAIKTTIPTEYRIWPDMCFTYFGRTGG